MVALIKFVLTKEISTLLKNTICMHCNATFHDAYIGTRAYKHIKYTLNSPKIYGDRHRVLLE